MSDELEQMQATIVSAVQQELSRFSREVDSVVKQIRKEISDGTAARTELEGQVRSLATAIEQSQNMNSKFQGELQKVIETRLSDFGEKTKRRHDEINTRLGRVVDEANNGIASAVESVARPLLKGIEHRQDKIESDVEKLGGNLRKFDAQAGQMVSHINTVTTAIEARLESVTSEMFATFDERHAALIGRLDEVSAAAARQQSEVANIVGTRVDATEDRMNERLVGLESRMNEEIGQRVADIDAHVGRVGAGLDDAVITLNDRIAKADSRFAEVEAQFAAMREDLANVDADAIDEMKDKISSALGQAELVRIEVERFQASVTESLDKSSVRITELETTVQDQNMDVETAVQLERLEEVERAVLMLDPDQFVRKSDMAGGVTLAGAGDMDVDATMPIQRPATMSDSGSASSPLAPPSADHDDPNASTSDDSVMS